MTFFRYIWIQIFAYIVDMGVFLILIELLAIGPLISNVVSKLVAGAFAFFLHRSFTFELKGRPHRSQALQYTSLLMINIPLTSIALALMLTFIPNVVIAKFLSDVSCFALSYFISKKYIFIDKKSKTINQADR